MHKFVKWKDTRDKGVCVGEYLSVCMCNLWEWKRENNWFKSQMTAFVPKLAGGSHQKQKELLLWNGKFTSDARNETLHKWPLILFSYSFLISFSEVSQRNHLTCQWPERKTPAICFEIHSALHLQRAQFPHFSATSLHSELFLAKRHVWDCFLAKRHGFLDKTMVGTLCRSGRNRFGINKDSCIGT